MVPKGLRPGRTHRARASGFGSRPGRTNRSLASGFGLRFPGFRVWSEVPWPQGLVGGLEGHTVTWPPILSPVLGRRQPSQPQDNLKPTVLPTLHRCGYLGNNLVRFLIKTYHLWKPASMSLTNHTPAGPCPFGRY